MDNVYKTAVASSDGIVVDQHFGHADTFYIYTVTDGVPERTGEIRKLEAACNGSGHNDERLSENIRRLSDCKYIIVSRIGMRAAQQAERLGVIPMELPGVIEDSMKKIISYEEINNLFERD